MAQVAVFIVELVTLFLGILILWKSTKVRDKFDGVLKVMDGHSTALGIGLVVLTILIACGYIYDGHDWGGDFSEYLGQAIAIVDGTIDVQIAHMQFVLENSIPGMCPAVYPWGLPVLLALVYKIFGFSIIAFRAMGVIFLAVFIWFVYRFLRRRFEVKDVVIMTMLFIGCKHYMECGTSILTDIPCSMFSMIGLYALYELIDCEDKKQYWWSTIIGVCSFFAYFLRSSGIVLILTLLCIHVVVILGKFIPFVQKQVEKTNLKKIIIPAHIVAYVIFLVGKIVTDYMFPSAGNDYLQFIEGMPVTYPLTNMMFYFKVLRDFFDVGNYLAIVCGVVLLVLLIVGMVVKFHQEAISVVYILGTMVMLYIFPYVSGIRYIFGIYPLFLMFAYYGMQWIIGKIKDRLKTSVTDKLPSIFRFCMVCVCGFMMVFSLRMIYKIHTQPHIDSAYTPQAKEAYEFLMENTEEDAVVMFFKPRVLWLNAQRYAYNTYDDVADLEKSDYVFFFIKDNFTNLREHVEANPDEYELMFDNVNFQIYKHNRRN